MANGFVCGVVIQNYPAITICCVPGMSFSRIKFYKHKLYKLASEIIS